MEKMFLFDSGHLNPQLGDRSGCRHCNLAHPHIHVLSRSRFRTGHASPEHTRGPITNYKADFDPTPAIAG
jgi:hypothetical protein